jgi:hypothetical protein
MNHYEEVPLLNEEGVMSEKKSEKVEAKSLSFGSIYEGLEAAVNLLTKKGPDALERVAEVADQVAQTSREAAEFLRGLSKASAKTKAAAGEQEKEEVMAELASLRNKCHTIATGGGNKIAASAKASALPPEMRSILAQLLVKLIDDLLRRMSE